MEKGKWIVKEGEDPTREKAIGHGGYGMVYEVSVNSIQLKAKRRGRSTIESGTK
jgi:hypothetical protein